MNVTAQVGDTLFSSSGTPPLDAAAAKRELRRRLRQRRVAIPEVDRRRAAGAVARMACRCPALHRARRVALYLPVGSELSTLPLIALLRARGAQIFVPLVQGPGEMKFQELKALSPRGFRPVISRRVSGPLRRAADMDVVVLPLLGFDVLGTRLGQGGGYYDRALSACRFRPYRLGLAYACQQHEALPHEAWDQPLDAVLTERGWRRFPLRLFPLAH